MLYLVIADIVNRHNKIITELEYFRHSREGTTIYELIPEEPSEIFVTEFEAHHGIISKYVLSMHWIQDPTA